MSKLFVVTGSPDGFGQALFAVEAIDLSGDDGLSCSIPAEYPVNTFGSSALKTSDGNPLICGGVFHLRECREYIPEQDSWHILSTSTVNNRSVTISHRLIQFGPRRNRAPAEV